MTDDLDDRIAQAIAAVGGEAVNLGDTGAVYDVLGEENGGTGNPLGLSLGLGETLIHHPANGSEGTTAEWANLVTSGVVDLSFRITAAVGEAVIGVVATLEGVLDQGQGLIQNDGLAYVLVSSAVARGDRVRASATAGKAETSPFGLKAFGTARSDSDGTGVWVFLTIGDEAITGATFEHRSLRGVPGILRHIDLVESSTVTATGLFSGSGEQLDPTTTNDHDNAAASGIVFASGGTRWVKIDVGAFGAFNGIRVAGFRAHLIAFGSYTNTTARLKGNTVDNLGTATTIATKALTIGGGAGSDSEALVAASAPYRYFWLDLSSIDDRFLLTEWSILEAAGAVIPVNDPTAVAGYLNDVLANLYTAIVANRWEPMTNGDVAAPEIVFADGDVVMVLVPA